METKQNINLNVEGNELIIRQGEAKKLYDREPLKFTGQLNAPIDYLEYRDPDRNKTYIQLDKRNAKITVVVGEDEHFKTIVEGVLEMDSHLKEFKINTNTRYSLKELAAICKRLRYYFEDKALNLELVSSLMNFSGKFEEIIAKQDDQRGNTNDTFTVRMIENAIPMHFTLNIPIFVGTEPVKFEVNILFEKREKTLSLWLESPELNEIFIAAVDEEFINQTERLNHIAGAYLILNK